MLVHVSHDDRSTFARAYHWSSRIMTIALEMALPGLAGHWLDEKFATGFALTLVGVMLGCSVAFWQLLKIARETPNSKPHQDQHDTDGK